MFLKSTEQPFQGEGTIHILRQLPENKIPDLRNGRWDQDTVFREMLMAFQPFLDYLERFFCYGYFFFVNFIQQVNGRLDSFPCHAASPFTNSFDRVE